MTVNHLKFLFTTTYYNIYMSNKWSWYIFACQFVRFLENAKISYQSFDAPITDHYNYQSKETRSCHFYSVNYSKSNFEI